MGNILISGLAIACLLTAIETFYKPIGKWRGLVAILTAIACNTILGTRALYMPIYILATTFVGLTISLMVEQLFIGTNERDLRNLPKRIPPR